MWRRLRSAPLRCAVAGASLCCGGARGGNRSGLSGENTAGGHRQIGWGMAFYLGGKISVGTNELPPKETTQMSHDVKYIGMDVHKEAL